MPISFDRVVSSGPGPGPDPGPVRINLASTNLTAYNGQTYADRITYNYPGNTVFNPIEFTVTCSKDYGPANGSALFRILDTTNSNDIGVIVDTITVQDQVVFFTGNISTLLLSSGPATWVIQIASGNFAGVQLFACEITE